MNKKTLLLILSILLLILIGLAIFLSQLPKSPTDVPEIQTEPPTSMPAEIPPLKPTETEDTTEASTTMPAETEPRIQKTSITLSAIGDLLLHDAVLDTCYDEASDTYDFSSIFTYVSGHLQAADCAVINFESTMAGSAYKIGGFPRFNSPDSILDSLKDAGIDLLLTSNNPEPHH